MKDFFKTFPLVGKAALILVLALIAVVMPVKEVTIIIVATILVFFGMLYRRKIMFSIAAGVLIIGLIVTKLAQQPVVQQFFIDKGIESNLFHMEDKGFAIADTEVEAEDFLIINGTGVKLEFNPAHDKILIPRMYPLKRSGDRLVIGEEEQQQFQKIQIIVGTKRTYKKIMLNAAGVIVKGNMLQSAGELILNGAGMKINADLKASRMEINSAGTKVTGSITGDELHVNGMGVKVISIINMKKLSVNGAGVKLRSDVKGLEKLLLKGTHVTVRLKYLDTWIGQRVIKVDGVGSKIRIKIPEKNKGELSVEGTQKVKVESY